MMLDGAGCLRGIGNAHVTLKEISQTIVYFVPETFAVS